MSFTTMNVPSTYGFVVLGAGLLPFLTNGYMSSMVMAARERLNVFYPNLYAVPGIHENAEEFNRIQRSHQNYLETLDQYMITTLLGGLQHPLACAIGTIFHSLGAILYMKGYSDMNYDAQTARYKKGGPMKYIGIFTSLFCTGKLAYKMITSSSTKK